MPAAHVYVYPVATREPPTYHLTSPIMATSCSVSCCPPRHTVAVSADVSPVASAGLLDICTRRVRDQASSAVDCAASALDCALAALLTAVFAVDCAFPAAVFAESAVDLAVLAVDFAV